MEKLGHRRVYCGVGKGQASEIMVNCTGLPDLTASGCIATEIANSSLRQIVTWRTGGKAQTMVLRTPRQATSPPEAIIAEALGWRSIVLVGMMGSGKTSIGRRVALRLGIPFVDAD